MATVVKTAGNNQGRKSTKPRRVSGASGRGAVAYRADREHDEPRSQWTISKTWDPSRVSFRRRREGLTIERQGDAWKFDWRGEQRALDGWAQIEASDGTLWIIEPPRGDTARYPRPPCPPIGKMVIGWYLEAGAALASAELAKDRTRTAVIAQIVGALYHSVRQDDLRAGRCLEKLEVTAKRYLKTLGTVNDRRNTNPRTGEQGHAVIWDRPAALDRLAAFWLPHVRWGHEEDKSASVLAATFVYDLRQQARYQRVATLLSKPLTAQGNEARAIAERYRSALQSVAQNRKRLLCRKCAPGLAMEGVDGNSYARPRPGDRTGWGCEGATSGSQSCGRIAEATADAHATEVARQLVRDSLIVLGLPAAKARSLYDFVRISEKRAASPRARGSAGR